MVPWKCNKNTGRNIFESIFGKIAQYYLLYNNPVHNGYTKHIKIERIQLAIWVLQHWALHDKIVVGTMDLDYLEGEPSYQRFIECVPEIL